MNQESSQQVQVMQLIEVLFEQPLKIIRQEKDRFESRVKEEKIKLRFKAVKGVVHGLWGLLAGVCIATDIELWKKKDFYLLAMINETSGQAVGYIHMYEQIIDGRKVLIVPGIEPSTEFLGQVDATEIYPLILQALREVAAKVGYQAIYLPTDSNILSNRSDIYKAAVELAVEKEYEKIPLKPAVQWNNLPTPYPINEVYEIPLDAAMETVSDKAELAKGGIDFNTDQINLQIQNAGEGIKFNIDPAMLAQLQNALGFIPVIINIQPMNNLKNFLDSF